MELAYKEDLFMILSASMEKEEAEKETERISSNFKSTYSPKVPKIEPIKGNKMYRYFIDRLPDRFMAEFQSRVDIYENGKWTTFMNFNGMFGGIHCRKLVERLKLGGNTVIEYE